ncbi:MAG: hypothetical protein PHO89_11820, partial [Methylacidiphilaceae bacterium]|nr:hypothetical protein [Candidatus Methylacidiphilaceae bacterium]
MQNWEPFVWEEIDPELLIPVNELCGKRRRLSFRCLESDFELRLGPPSGGDALTAGFHFLVHGMRAWLGLPSFVCLGVVDPELAPYWCSEYAGEGELGRIAAELAWEPFGEVLEQAGGGRGRLGGMAGAPDPACTVRFLLQARRNGEPWLASELAVEPRLAKFWGEAVARTPAERRKLDPEVPVRVSLAAGELLLDLATFRLLKRGDVLFPDEPFPQIPMVVQVCGIPWGEAVLDESGTNSKIRVVPNHNLTGDPEEDRNSEAASSLEE